MCVIAISRKGERQPNQKELQAMFRHNPHGAGYMYARDGKVTIHKGFMNWEDFNRAVRAEGFTKEDPVVYHFRVSTQAGVNPEMTHPFPLTSRLDLCEKTDLRCPIGLAHNGIIHMTSDFREKNYSDTALFITKYLVKLIRRKDDIRDRAILDMIEELTNSKWALMDGDGNISYVGNFLDNRGVLFSNGSYQDVTVRWRFAK